MTIQEANKTPLSQAAKALAHQPRDTELYLVQAMELALSLVENREIEVDLPDEWLRVMRELIGGWMDDPQVYLDLTEPNPDECAELNHPKEELQSLLTDESMEPLDRLAELLDWLAENLNCNGYDLDPSAHDLYEPPTPRQFPTPEMLAAEAELLKRTPEEEQRALERFLKKYSGHTSPLVWPDETPMSPEENQEEVEAFPPLESLGTRKRTPEEAVKLDKILSKLQAQQEALRKKLHEK